MGINYIGPFNRTGYGIASMGYANGLRLNKTDFSFHVIGGIDMEQEEVASNRALLENVSRAPNPEEPAMCFWHLHDIPNQISAMKGLVHGLTTFEVDSLSKPEIEAGRRLASVSTASQWGRQVLENYFGKVHVLPHAFQYLSSDVVPTINYNPTDGLTAWKKLVSPAQLPADTFVVTSAGKYEIRKGHPELLDACIQLSKERPVLLVGFWYNPFIVDGYPFAEIHRRGLYPVFTTSGLKVFSDGKFLLAIMPPTPSRRELHSALTKAHIFASPSRGEGWDLPLFEVMSYGMPCMATLNTAHLDYCNTYNVVPVESPDLVTAFDGRFFHGTSKWYNVTVEAVLASLRKVANMPKAELHNLGMVAHNSTKNFTWQESAKKMMELLQ